MRRIIAVILPFALACAAPPADPIDETPVCECGERVCGVMDCGRVCGSCEGEAVCSIDGLSCIAPLPVGSACELDRQCGVNRKCLRPGTYLPGGYCTLACEDDDDCPGAAACGLSRDGDRVCLATCDATSTCRTDEGYLCDEGICSACVPTCEGRTCGSDGCGGACGVVYEEVPACDDAGETCSAGNCVGSFQVNSYQLPTDRFDVAAFPAANGSVLLVGGRETVQYAGQTQVIGTRGVKKVQAFDPVGGTFAELGDLPELIGRANAALVGNTLYVAGGTLDPDDPEAPDTASTKFFKQVGTGWQTMLQGLPEVSMGGAAEAIGETLYLLPGEVDGVASAGFWSFDGSQWTQEAARPTARTLFSVARDGERLWVVGGWDGEAPVATVEAWSVAEGWMTMTSLPVAVASPRALVHGGRLFVFGGYEGPEAGTIRPWVQTIDLETGAAELLGTTYKNFVRQAPVVTRSNQVLLIGAHELSIHNAPVPHREILRFLVPAR